MANNQLIAGHRTRRCNAILALCRVAELPRDEVELITSSTGSAYVDELIAAGLLVDDAGRLLLTDVGRGRADALRVAALAIDMTQE